MIVGSRGIRRRKRKHPLAPVRGDALGWPTSDETPPIMWSDPGSGFEADPFSPAGRMQRQWWFLRRFARLSNREVGARAGSALRAALPPMVAFVVVAGAIEFLSLVVGLGLAFGIVAFLVVVLLMKRG